MAEDLEEAEAVVVKVLTAAAPVAEDHQPTKTELTVMAELEELPLQEAMVETAVQDSSAPPAEEEELVASQTKQQE